MAEITFIGHASMLIKTNGVNILTDPVFSDRPYPLGLFKRAIPAGMSIDELPRIDAILLSHLHPDHYDPPSLRQLDKKAKVFTPKGYGWMGRRLGFKDTVELDGDRWESVELGKGKKKVRITGIRSLHPFHCTGHMIEGDQTMYIPGDTGYFDRIREIPKKFKVDTVFLPLMRQVPVIRNLNQHISALDGMQIVRDLRPKKAMPIHWGYFPHTDIEKDRFMAMMENEYPKKLLYMGNGQTKRI